MWLAVSNILTGAESRSKALASSARCSAALRLRPLLTDILMDQLPVLKDLRRVLDELMLGCSGITRDNFSSCLILEQVGNILLTRRHLFVHIYARQKIEDTMTGHHKQTTAPLPG